jgi:hypothetical protein
MIKICDICRDLYSKTSYNNTKQLKTTFNGYEKIEKNYSQAYQDMFVLSMLDGKENGTYLEIGSGHPSVGSNSYLLEKLFKWKGLSIDKIIHDDFYKERNSKTLMSDALDIDYISTLSNVFLDDLVIDYLQIDCDPPKQSYEILKKIPFDLYKFAVITFEHDYYCDPDKIYRSLSRDFLYSIGYELVVGNIGVNSFSPFEDWWVNPNLISYDIVKKFKNTTTKNIDVEEYMLDNFISNKIYICDHV